MVDITMVDCPKENRVSVAAYYLSKSAHTWWLSVRPADGAYTWEEFKNLMLDRYYPGPLREAKLSELLNPEPSKDDDVLTIAEKFQALLPFSTLILRSEVDKIKYFLKRLKPCMRMQLLNHNCMMLAEIIEKVHDNDLTAKEISKKQPQSSNKRFKNQNQTDGNRGVFKKPQSVQNTSGWAPMPSKPAGSYSRAANSSIICHNYRESGHNRYNCSRPAMTCNNCGVAGHRAKFCRGGPGHISAASHVPTQHVFQSKAPSFAFYQTTGANRGMGRGNQVGVYGSGTAKPRVYEMKKADNLDANMILEIDDNPSRCGRIINAVKAVNLFNQGCVVYWCYMTKTMDRPGEFANVPIVRDHPDVFPDELTGLPPHRET
ncbi:hypothetical protein OROMI_002870 [Orobanche minor]